MNMATVSC